MLETIFISIITGCLSIVLALVLSILCYSVYKESKSKLLVILVILIAGSFWISLVGLMLIEETTLLTGLI